MLIEPILIDLDTDFEVIRGVGRSPFFSGITASLQAGDAKSDARLTEALGDNNGLGFLAERWPHLPAAIRDQILAFVLEFGSVEESNLKVDHVKAETAATNPF